MSEMLASEGAYERVGDTKPSPLAPAANSREDLEDQVPHDRDDTPPQQNNDDIGPDMNGSDESSEGRPWGSDNDSENDDSRYVLIEVGTRGGARNSATRISQKDGTRVMFVDEEPHIQPLPGAQAVLFLRDVMAFGLLPLSLIFGVFSPSLLFSTAYLGCVLATFLVPNFRTSGPLFGEQSEGALVRHVWMRTNLVSEVVAAVSATIHFFIAIGLNGRRLMGERVLEGAWGPGMEISCALITALCALYILICERLPLLTRRLEAAMNQRSIVNTNSSFTSTSSLRASTLTSATATNGVDMNGYKWGPCLSITGILSGMFHLLPASAVLTVVSLSMSWTGGGVFSIIQAVLGGAICLSTCYGDVESANAPASFTTAAHIRMSASPTTPTAATRRHFGRFALWLSTWVMAMSTVVCVCAHWSWDAMDSNAKIFFFGGSETPRWVTILANLICFITIACAKTIRANYTGRLWAAGWLHSTFPTVTTHVHTVVIWVVPLLVVLLRPSLTGVPWVVLWVSIQLIQSNKPLLTVATALLVCIEMAASLVGRSDAATAATPGLVPFDTLPWAYFVSLLVLAADAACGSALAANLRCSTTASTSHLSDEEMRELRRSMRADRTIRGKARYRALQAMRYLSQYFVIVAFASLFLAAVVRVNFIHAAFLSMFVFVTLQRSFPPILWTLLTAYATCLLAAMYSVYVFADPDSPHLVSIGFFTSSSGVEVLLPYFAWSALFMLQLRFYGRPDLDSISSKWSHFLVGVENVSNSILSITVLVLFTVVVISEPPSVVGVAYLAMLIVAVFTIFIKGFHAPPVSVVRLWRWVVVPLQSLLVLFVYIFAVAGDELSETFETALAGSGVTTAALGVPAEIGLKSLWAKVALLMMSVVNVRGWLRHQIVIGGKNERDEGLERRGRGSSAVVGKLSGPANEPSAMEEMGKPLLDANYNTALSHHSSSFTRSNTSVGMAPRVVVDDDSTTTGKQEKGIHATTTTTIPAAPAVLAPIASLISAWMDAVESLMLVYSTGAAILMLLVAGTVTAGPNWPRPLSIIQLLYFTCGVAAASVSRVRTSVFFWYVVSVFAGLWSCVVYVTNLDFVNIGTSDIQNYFGLYPSQGVTVSMSSLLGLHVALFATAGLHYGLLSSVQGRSNLHRRRIHALQSSTLRTLSNMSRQTTTASLTVRTSSSVNPSSPSTKPSIRKAITSRARDVYDTLIHPERSVKRWSFYALQLLMFVSSTLFTYDIQGWFYMGVVCLLASWGRRVSLSGRRWTFLCVALLAWCVVQYALRLRLPVGGADTGDSALPTSSVNSNGPSPTEFLNAAPSQLSLIMATAIYCVAAMQRSTVPDGTYIVPRGILICELLTLYSKSIDKARQQRSWEPLGRILPIPSNLRDISESTSLKDRMWMLTFRMFGSITLAVCFVHSAYDVTSGLDVTKLLSQIVAQFFYQNYRQLKWKGYRWWTLYLRFHIAWAFARMLPFLPVPGITDAGCAFKCLGWMSDLAVKEGGYDDGECFGGSFDTFELAFHSIVIACLWFETYLFTKSTYVFALRKFHEEEVSYMSMGSAIAGFRQKALIRAGRVRQLRLLRCLHFVRRGLEVWPSERSVEKDAPSTLIEDDDNDHNGSLTPATVNLAASFSRRLDSQLEEGNAAGLSTSFASGTPSLRKFLTNTSMIRSTANADILQPSHVDNEGTMGSGPPQTMRLIDFIDAESAAIEADLATTVDEDELSLAGGTLSMLPSSPSTKQMFDSTQDSNMPESEGTMLGDDDEIVNRSERSPTILDPHTLALLAGVADEPLGKSDPPQNEGTPADAPRDADSGVNGPEPRAAARWRDTLLEKLDAAILWLDTKSLSRGVDKFTQSGLKKGRIVPLLICLYRFVFSNTDSLAYFLFSLQFALNPSILASIPPVTAFVYASAMNPRPHRRYWQFILVFLQTTIILTSILRVTVCFKATTANKGIPSPIYGRICTGDAYLVDILVKLACILSIVIHVAHLRRWGLWHDCELCLQTPVPPRYISGLVAGAKETIHNLKTHEKKLGVDYFELRFGADLIAMLYLFFAYFKLQGSTNSAVASIQSSILPGELAVIMVVLFMLIVVDRIVFLLRRIALRALLNAIVTIGVHVVAIVWFVQHATFVRDYYTSSFWLRGSLPLAGFLYLIKALNLYLGAKQVSQGSVGHSQHLCFTGGYKTPEFVFYMATRLTPFVYDMKVVLDWIVVRTSLKLYYWTKLEDIAHELYLVLVDRVDDADIEKFKKRRRSPYPGLLKYPLGILMFALLSFILVFPLLLYSSFSPVLAQNEVISINAHLGIEGVPQFWTASSRASNYERQDRVNASVIALLDKTRPGLIGAGLSYDATQFFTFSNYSTALWTITPPALSKLLLQLTTPASPLYLTLQLEINSLKGTTGDGYQEQRILLSPAIKLSIYTMLTNSSVLAIKIPNLFDPFIFINNGEFGTSGDGVNSESCTLYQTLATSGAAFFALECQTLFTLSNPNVEGWGGLTPAENSCYRGGGCTPYSSIASRANFSIAPVTVVATSGVVLDASFLQSIGIVAAYTTFVLAIGRVLRFAVSGAAYRVTIEDIEDPTLLVCLIELMFILREKKKFQFESLLYLELMDTLRDTAALRAKTSSVFTRGAGASSLLAASAPPVVGGDATMV